MLNGTNFVPVTKDIFKQMSSAEKEEVISHFKRECLMASDDIQGVIDFATDVIRLSHKLPVKLDFSQIIAAINNEEVADPTVIEHSEVAKGGENVPE